MDERSMEEIARELKADGVRCNCDLDNWEPEQNSGHSWVCRIHKRAVAIKRGEVRPNATARA